MQALHPGSTTVVEVGSMITTGPGSVQPAASWLRDHPAARTGARAVLWPAAGAARAVVEAVRHPLASLALFMGLAACALALVRRGARR